MRNFATPPIDPRRYFAPTLLAVLRHELATRRFYQGVITSFGSVAPWPQLLTSCNQRIQSLYGLMASLGIAPPAGPIGTGPAPVPGWRNNIEQAMHGCVIGTSLYQQLISALPDDTMRRQVQRLQTELLTRGLPALQNAWQAAADRERYHALQGFDPSQTYNSHGVIGDTIEQLLALLTRQGGLFGLAGTLLRAAHPALVAGAVTGGAAIQGLRQLRRNPNDKTS